MESILALIFRDIPELRRHGFGVSCIVSGQSFELVELGLVDLDEAVEDITDPLQVDPVLGEELRVGCERGVAKALRCLAVDPHLELVDAFNEALREVLVLWQQGRPNCRFLIHVEDRVAVEAAGLEPPIVRVEDVGRDFVEATWYMPGDVGFHADIDFFEVELRKYSDTFNADTGDLPELESLGVHVVAGTERSYIVRDLRACCLYKVRVRAVLTGAQQHSTGWSADASGRTQARDGPVAVPRAATGRPQARHPAAVGPLPTKQCLVPTEQDVAERASASSRARRAQTRPGSAPAARSSRSGYSAGGSRPLVPERSRRGDRRGVGRATGALNAAFGEISAEDATRECLHARKCKNWNDFVRIGQHCGRDPTTREKRLQRLRMVVAQAELHDPAYAREGRFAMGPFYTDERGRRVYEAMQEKMKAEDRTL